MPSHAEARWRCSLAHAHRAAEARAPACTPASGAATVGTAAVTRVATALGLPRRAVKARGNATMSSEGPRRSVAGLRIGASKRRLPTCWQRVARVRWDRTSLAKPVASIHGCAMRRRDSRAYILLGSSSPRASAAGCHCRFPCWPAAQQDAGKGRREWVEGTKV